MEDPLFKVDTVMRRAQETIASDTEFERCAK